MLNFRFKCLDGSCIQLKDRCNHVHNCAHGEDEEQCAGVCRGDQWMCADTKCIDKSQLCDNVTQCQDGSDEMHCQKNWRRDNNFWYTSSPSTYFETSSSS